MCGKFGAKSFWAGKLWDEKIGDKFVRRRKSVKKNKKTTRSNLVKNLGASAFKN